SELLASIRTCYDQCTVDAAADALGAFALHFLSVNAPDDDPSGRGNAGMVQRLVNRFVSILVLDVLADHADGHFVGGVPDALQHAAPVADIKRPGFESQVFHAQAVEP